MHLDTLGRLHYVVTFEDWDGWAILNEALLDKRWASLAPVAGSAVADPAAKQVETISWRR